MKELEHIYIYSYTSIDIYRYFTSTLTRRQIHPLIYTSIVLCVVILPLGNITKSTRRPCRHQAWSQCCHRRGVKSGGEKEWDLELFGWGMEVHMIWLSIIFWNCYDCVSVWLHYHFNVYYLSFLIIKSHRQHASYSFTLKVYHSLRWWSFQVSIFFEYWRCDYGRALPMEDVSWSHSPNRYFQWEMFPPSYKLRIPSKSDVFDS